MNDKVNINALMSQIQSSKFVVVLHYYSTGPGQELHQWLCSQKALMSTLIEHPFSFSNRQHCHIETFEEGLLTHSAKLKRWMPLNFVRFFLDFWRSIFVVLSSKNKYDWYIGNGFFDALAGIFLRMIGKTKSVAVYTIDYAPGKDGSFYNFLYKRLDRWCCQHCDVIWNLSDRMQEARIDNGLKNSAPAIRVPHGTHAHDIDLNDERDEHCRIAFMGHVQEKSGIDLFLTKMPELLKIYPQMHFDVLGDGPCRLDLIELSKKLKIDAHVTFHGFFEKHSDLEAQLCKSDIGLALYDPNNAGFSAVADPGKPKVYLACGLPIVITDVIEFANEVQESKAGVVAEYNAESIAEAIELIIGDYKNYKAQAIHVGQKYNWQNIFCQALDYNFNQVAKDD